METLGNTWETMENKMETSAIHHRTATVVNNLVMTGNKMATSENMTVRLGCSSGMSENTMVMSGNTMAMSENMTATSENMKEKLGNTTVKSENTMARSESKTVM